MVRELRQNNRVVDLIIQTPGQENQQNELYMEYDRRALTLSNQQPQDIYYTLGNLLENGSADDIEISDDRKMPVVVRPSTKETFDTWKLRNSYIAVKGMDIRPSSFMDINQREAKNVIPRENQEYILNVAFNVLGSYTYTARLMDRTIEKYNHYFPVGFRCQNQTYDYYEDEGTQYWLIGIVAVIIFFIIAILYESLMQALAIVLLIPVSFIGLFLTYYITGVPFGTGGYAAMVLLSGLTVNAGIYIICQNNNQRKMILIPSGWDTKKRIMMGSRRYVTAFSHKITPIFLTILSTILGMLPFLIDGPDEQPFWYSLAIGTIGGLLFSIIPIILFLPSVLRLKR